MPGSAHFNPSAVRGVRTSTGDTLLADKTVLCAGAWSREIAAQTGLDLQIRPAAVPMAAFARRTETHATVLDAPAGIAFRPESSDATLAWRVGPATEEPMASPEATAPDLDGATAVELAERVAGRMPVSGGTDFLGSITAMVDLSPDGLPLIGPTFVPGLWVCAGWSGMGFECVTGATDALALWLRMGRRPPELAPYSPSRELGSPVT
jgi:glycine/D-amino acid oxidase-like deaminating enzyme